MTQSLKKKKKKEEKKIEWQIKTINNEERTGGKIAGWTEYIEYLDTWMHVGETPNN